MKPSKENIEILKKLRFSKDLKWSGPDESKNAWYSLDNGWGFRLDAVKDFKKLFENALKYQEE